MMPRATNNGIPTSNRYLERDDPFPTSSRTTIIIFFLWPEEEEEVSDRVVPWHRLFERNRGGNQRLATMADLMEEGLPSGRAPVLTEASPGSTILDGGDNAHAVDMDDVHAPRQSDQASAAAAPTANISAIERGGSQASVADGGGGRAGYIDIDVHAPQQNDQASVEAAPTTNLTVVEQVLSAVSAGLVLISISNSNFMGDYPEFIKLGLFAACVVLTVSTFVGIMKKKMGKVAMRLLACVSIIAMTTTAVYQVSEKASIKCAIAVTGGIATMVMGFINWR